MLYNNELSHAQAHNGPVWKLEWAHPEFGQVLASCSFDRTVCIWEEPQQQAAAAEPTSNNATPTTTTTTTIGSNWIQKSTLVDSTDNVVDIKFAPRHLGLKLATCSLDGHVRVYEAIDVMNLAHWPLESMRVSLCLHLQVVR